jgi:hypothetical protein
MNMYTHIRDPYTETLDSVSVPRRRKKDPFQPSIFSGERFASPRRRPAPSRGRQTQSFDISWFTEFILSRSDFNIVIWGRYVSQSVICCNLKQSFLVKSSTL